MKVFFSISLFFFTLCTIATDAVPVKRDEAAAILNRGPRVFDHTSIITDHEWKELQLDRLLMVLDRTKTSSGRWGLEQLLHPIIDQSALARRQNIIRSLIENPDLLAQLQHQLVCIHEMEEALFAYWNLHDEVARNVTSFYYSMPVLKNHLNKSVIALEGGVAMSMLTACMTFMQSLCLDGINTEFGKFLFNPDHETFDIYQGVRDGLKKPFLMHSPELNILAGEAEGGYSFKKYIGALIFGSLGDRYTMFEAGLDLPKFVKKVLPNKKIVPTKLLSKNKITPVVAALFALVPTVIYDVKWAWDIRTIYTNITVLNAALTALQHRIMQVATCINNMTKIRDILDANASPELTQMWDSLALISDDVAECIEQLQHERFSQERSYYYSRGHVLRMHVRIQKIKQSFIPLLQAVALVDAYCSIAQLYNEHASPNRESNLRFCFPHYVTDESLPILSSDSAWLALLSPQHAVTNAIYCAENQPSKIVITGPNGGGKSTYLKMVGQIAVLAQSWTIVPAHATQLSLFSCIRTGLAPHEDLSQGLSTFMAEKKRMQELKDEINRGAQQHEHVLVLIDEPYRGTVDDESAKRIYTFGTDIAHSDNAIVYIATHVKKPIYLAQDLAGLFANYQIEIKSLANNRFERTFKCIPGPAIWWFEDEEKRSQFIDWIG